MMDKADRLDDASIKDASGAARALGADLENSLTLREVARRFSEDGPNELDSAPPRPAWRRMLSHFDVIHVLLLGVSLAVAAVPEGLPAILSAVLALGVQRMATHSAIVKNLSSVETLGSASVIASDKIGALTRSEMTIERVMTASGGTRVTGVGYAAQGRRGHDRSSARRGGACHSRGAPGGHPGDHPRTAARIAADLGIVEAGVPALSGIDLDALDDATFAEAVQKTSGYARVAPQHKLRIVDALQADGSIVAMTGDGVNDEPALKSADISIAMGVTGAEVTKEAANRILAADDNFATIVAAVREGRGIVDNIRKFLRYLLSSNMGEVLTVFLGVVGAGVIGLTGGRRHSAAAAARDADPVDQSNHRLRTGTRDGRRPAH